MESKTVTIKGIDAVLWEHLKIRAIRKRLTVAETLNAILRKALQAKE